MDTTHQTANEQAALWNGSAGRAWVAAQSVLDEMFKPFENLIVDTMCAGSGQRVLDIGCGTGSTTLAAARRLGAKGHCVGADISAPMIAVAQTRAEREGSTASFICADAQTYAFAPASFDRIMSRFGVMFFDDSVAAFANLRRAASDGAELCCIVWRSAADNPFMTTAERAAAPLLPNLPARRPGAPGQFAFADRRHVSSILEESGWAEIDIRPLDVDCTLAEKELAGYFTRLGPVGLVLQNADERTRAQVIERVRAAFDPYVHGIEVRYTAACWMVSARAPSA
ncbi:class I SAM-dependent methyltransferase [Paraburkholderia elongata]|uniref:Methyltransferase domain-containing protein n=1 Tax=Paraburkholderia elongata TaxID=2675747 RepID=A0A972NSZ1_9BURK|nr:class I SAM-dependent methyltransferase [Paraburkholderia elongata]NPT57893.1 methyltransferase domain-containing protein [Paraburkholderia elongata]